MAAAAPQGAAAAMRALAAARQLAGCARLHTAAMASSSCGAGHLQQLLQTHSSSSSSGALSRPGGLGWLQALMAAAPPPGSTRSAGATHAAQPFASLAAAAAAAGAGGMGGGMGSSATSSSSISSSAGSAPAGQAALFHNLPRQYRGDSLMPSGSYWFKQLSLNGSGVTTLLVAANAAAFGMQTISPTMTALGMRIGYKIANGEWWRLLTPVFLHGNLLHVLVNTFATWNLGRFTEPRIGGAAFAAVYFGSGVCGNLLSYLMSPLSTTSLGSSSALFGLMGALAVAALRGHLDRAEARSIGQTLLINGALMLAFSGAMDIWAHAGGFAGGAAIMGLMRLSGRRGRFGGGW